MRFQAIAIALALVLTVAAAGCGSKKSASTTGGSGSTTTTTSVTTSSGGNGGSTTSTMSTTTTTTSSSGGALSFASTKNCAQLASIGQKFSQAMTAANGTGKASLTEVATIYKAFASAAPSEIRSDFETIAVAFSNYATELQKAGYTTGKVPTASQMAAIVQASKTFSSAKLVAAEHHLSAWGAKNCTGFKTTTG